MLVCNTCNKCLTESSFHKSSTSKSGYRGECKKCRKLKDLNYYEQNKEKVLNTRKKYYDRTRDDPIFKEKRKGCQSNHYKNNYEKYILRRCKKRATTNGLEFNLDLSDIIIPERCPVLGIELQKGIKKATKSSPSVDRINPELGYIKGNIQIISQLANAMKSNATKKELLSFAKWVIETFEDDQRGPQGLALGCEVR